MFAHRGHIYFFKQQKFTKQNVISVPLPSNHTRTHQGHCKHDLRIQTSSRALLLCECFATHV